MRSYKSNSIHTNGAMMHSLNLNYEDIPAARINCDFLVRNRFRDDLGMSNFELVESGEYLTVIWV